MDIRQEIKKEISRLSLIPVDEIKDNTPILDKGVVDSVSLLELILFLESNFHIRIEPKHLTQQFFGTIDSICKLVESFESTD